MEEYMLTTFDNPYDPFEDFENWFLYDIEQGYNTCGYLARISNTNSDLPDSVNNERIEEAIDEILANDFLGIYKKVSRSSEEKKE